MGCCFKNRICPGTVPSPRRLLAVEELKKLSQSPDIRKNICASIAPGIFGRDDVKIAVACLLFGGTPKNLSGKMKLRGDLNVLLLG